MLFLSLPTAEKRQRKNRETTLTLRLPVIVSYDASSLALSPWVAPHGALYDGNGPRGRRPKTPGGRFRRIERGQGNQDVYEADGCDKRGRTLV